MASSCGEALAKKYLLANLTSARHLRWSHHKLKLRSPMVGCPKAQAGGLRKPGSISPVREPEFVVIQIFN